MEAFYQTPTDFDVAINGAYATLASNGAYNRSYVLLHEMRSDNTMNGGGATGLAEVFHRIAHFSELSTQEELSDSLDDGVSGHRAHQPHPRSGGQPGGSERRQPHPR